MISHLSKGTINGKIAKQLVIEILETGKSPSTIIDEKGLAQVNDSGAINALIDGILLENPKAVEDIKSGKTQTMGFLVGQVMRKSQGKANPEQVNLRLKEVLGLS
jgi:aspartyl-tRNA(Asn)/glutamyl-tRNA(Gln) amidotransferase subunit B